MRNLVSSALIGIVSLQLGCATILASKSQSVAINSTPQQADVYIDGIKRGVTPLSLDLDPRRSYTIVFKKEGLEDKVFDVRNKVSGGWVVLDILFGLVPVIVDAGSGAWSTLDADAVRVSWVPKELPPSESALNCNLSGTDAWKSASAVEKKRMLDDCRKSQEQQQPATSAP